MIISHGQLSFNLCTEGAQFEIRQSFTSGRKLSDWKFSDRTSPESTIIVNTSIFEGLGDELFIPIACLVAPSGIHDEAIQTLQSEEIINTQMLQQHRQTIHKTTSESLGPTTSLLDDHFLSLCRAVEIHGEMSGTRLPRNLRG